MFTQRLMLSRIISSSRPLRSPNPTKQTTGLRLFTQNSQLLIISRATLRPQLPFLHGPCSIRAPTSLARGQFQYQVSRLLTTERKLYIKDQLWKAAKYTVYGWTMVILLFISMWGLLQERLERHHQSPPMWNFWSQVIYRDAWSEEDIQRNGTGVVNWLLAGNGFRKLLSRLEDPSIDGFDLHPILEDEGDIYVPGVGKTGFDISSKPEPWRRGYHATIMGCARAAEHLEGWVRDTTRNMAFPPEVVIGPSNPRPKPVKVGTAAAPLEENCEPAFEKPETYYMKILTTRGFTTRQRLDAALACADYLDFKGLHSSAEEMYDWGLDIAMGALPTGVDGVADTKSGIINADASYISSNLLLATTSLAMHHARNNNLATALPVFLSVLRARRKLSSTPTPSLSKSEYPAWENDTSVLRNLVSSVASLLVSPAYPTPPPTGDEILVRTPVEMCEEAALMAYIGEIIFASASLGSAPNTVSGSSKRSLNFSSDNGNKSQNQQSGLSWTRDAVDLAEAILLSGARDDPDARTKCLECLEVGMGNWSKMVNKLLREEREKESPTQQNSSSGGNWFWGGSSITVEEGKDVKWQQEARLVEEKLKSVNRLLREEQRKKEAAGTKSGLFFF